MTQDQVSEAIRRAHIQKKCETASVLLRDGLRNHPDNDDLRDEGSSLYMNQTALQQTSPPPAVVKTHLA